MNYAPSNQRQCIGIDQKYSSVQSRPTASDNQLTKMKKGKWLIGSEADQQDHLTNVICRKGFETILLKTNHVESM